MEPSAEARSEGHPDHPLQNSEGGPTIDNLLIQVPDNPAAVLTNLGLYSHLANAQDHNGYSLLHAGASYRYLDLMRTLVKEYNVDPNIADNDHETPLFYAESISVARCLVEELGADPNWRNSDGQTADEKMEAEGDEEDELVLTAEYLYSQRRRKDNSNNDTSSNAAEPSADQSSDATDVHAPPPLPKDIQINFSTMQDPPLVEDESPDPEFRRRIEELASRDDFKSDAGQAELRNLVKDAVKGVASDQHDAQGRDVRRRVT